MLTLVIVLMVNMANIAYAEGKGGLKMSKKYLRNIRTLPNQNTSKRTQHKLAPTSSSSRNIRRISICHFGF